MAGRLWRFDRSRDAFPMASKLPDECRSSKGCLEAYVAGLKGISELVGHCELNGFLLCAMGRKWLRR
jgi:hypothetical protein